MNNSANVTSAQNISNEALLKEHEGKEIRIKRKSFQARITHAVNFICVLLLTLSGLFVFVPAPTAMLPAQVVFTFRMAHRVIGMLFVLFPLASAILAPKGVMHIFKNLFAKWDSDDKKWMALFMPYLFMAKHLHMPDQSEVKSGQRFADGMLWLACVVMGVSGVSMLLGSTVFDMPGNIYSVFLLMHDIGFFIIAVFGLAHIFLGAGIFQPYRGTLRIMFGDGTVSESDALYHWGHWARKEIASGKNLVEAQKDNA